MTARRPRRWYDDVPPATFEVPCRGETHRITWRRGKLVLEDHRDLRSEEILVALGAEPAPCLELLAGWRRSRASFDHSIDDIWRGRFFGLPPAYRSRSLLGMFVHWERHWHDPAFRDARRVQIANAIERHAWDLLRRFVEQRRRATALGPQITMQVEVRVADGEPLVRGELDRRASRIEAELGPRWLSRVWMRGRATPTDAFVVDVLGEDRGEQPLAVRAARWREREDGASFVVIEDAALCTAENGDAHVVWTEA